MQESVKSSTILRVYKECENFLLFRQLIKQFGYFKDNPGYRALVLCF